MKFNVGDMVILNEHGIKYLKDEFPNLLKLIDVNSAFEIVRIRSYSEDYPYKVDFKIDGYKRDNNLIFKASELEPAKGQISLPFKF